MDITVDYNDGGATANKTLTAVVGSPLAKPADPVRDGFKLKLNAGIDLNVFVSGCEFCTAFRCVYYYAAVSGSVTLYRTCGELIQYAVVTLTCNSYPSTMTVIINA